MFQPRISWSGRKLIALTYWGAQTFGDQKLPTDLAHLSVTGARIALGEFASVEIAQVFVDASLVGSGVGEADTGIAGVCLCWWNAEGCQCYGCRRHVQYCPVHQLFLF